MSEINFNEVVSTVYILHTSIGHMEVLTRNREQNISRFSHKCTFSETRNSVDFKVMIISSKKATVSDVGNSLKLRLKSESVIVILSIGSSHMTSPAAICKRFVTASLLKSYGHQIKSQCFITQISLHAMSYINSKFLGDML